MSVSRAELKKIIDVNAMAPIFLTQKLASYFDEMTRVLFIGSDYVGIDKKLRPHIFSAVRHIKVCTKSGCRIF